MDEPTLELKTLPSTLKYVFLDEEKAKPVIISSKLDLKQEEKLLEVLWKNKEAIGWTLTDLKGLDPSLCTLRIFLEDESRPVREAQRRLNPRVWEAVKEEIIKWLNAEIIYPISDSQWVSPVHVVPKKAGVTVTMNEKGEEIQTRLPTKWRVCIDYRKLNSVTKKDHFLLPFIDQILDRLDFPLPFIDQIPLIWGVITVEMKCTRWTYGLLAIFWWRSNGQHQTMPLLHTRRGKIWTLHLRSSRCDLKTMIRESTFKFESLIKYEMTHPTVASKFSYKIDIFFNEKLVLGFSSKSNYLDTQSEN